MDSINTTAAEADEHMTRARIYMGRAETAASPSEKIKFLRAAEYRAGKASEYWDSVIAALETDTGEDIGGEE